jgi:C1A family cysteine protease
MAETRSTANNQSSPTAETQTPPDSSASNAKSRDHTLGIIILVAQCLIFTAATCVFLVSMPDRENWSKRVTEAEWESKQLAAELQRLEAKTKALSAGQEKQEQQTAKLLKTPVTKWPDIEGLDQQQIAFSNHGKLIKSGDEGLTEKLLSIYDDRTSEPRVRLPRASEPDLEITRDRAKSVLGISEQFYETLTTTKEQLSIPKFNSFKQQFGRLSNGMPTVDIDRETYFVLIPLSELERDGTGTDAENAAQFKELVSKAGESTPEDEKDKGTSPAPALPSTADHRMQQSAVRDQGHRGTCVAFAALAELEAILKQSGEDRELCANLAYLHFMNAERSTPCDDPGIATIRAPDYLKDHTVGDASHWPYVGSDPTVLGKDGNCDRINVPPAAILGTDGVGIESCLTLPAGSENKPDGSVDIRDTQTLETLINAGHDVVFGAVYAWEQEDTKGIVDVKLTPSGHPVFGIGGHAMVIVGYDRSGAKPYFIVKNSWGPQYGHDGYVYLSYDYLRTYGKYGYVTTKIFHKPVQL